MDLNWTYIVPRMLMLISERLLHRAIPSFTARTPARERKGVRPVGLERKGVSLGHLRASLCDPVDPAGRILQTTSWFAWLHPPITASRYTRERFTKNWKSRQLVVILLQNRSFIHEIRDVKFKRISLYITENF